MGLMDKFKNLFTDEEEFVEEDDVDTVEIKEVKKEEEVNKLPTFMREKIKEEEKKTIIKLDDDLDTDNGEIPSSDGGISLPKLEEKKTFKFPVDLNDDDFVETRSRQSIHHKIKEETTEKEPKKMEVKPQTQQEQPKVADLYKDKRPEKTEVKTKFKATPIISPIYGILDKNYTTGDIENSSVNNLEERRHSKNVDFDSVRKKAYGSLSQEIKENLMCENCEYLKEAKECKYERERERIETKEYSYETPSVTKAPSYSDITLDEATENYYDYGVEYAKKEVESPRDEVIISNFEDEKPKKDIPPVKSSINLLSTLKKSMGDEPQPTEKKEENLELTDDLFNLIDSMYDERNEK